MEKVDQSPPIVSITPSDTTIYIPPLVGVRVGTTAGDITVVSGGETVLIPDVQVGETLPGSINQVLATGTDAVGITGWQWKNLN